MKKNTNEYELEYEKMMDAHIKETYRANPCVTTCCICGAKLPIAFSHNPYPVREKSWFGQKENRCCSDCNTDLVLPARISLPHRDVLTRNILIARYKNMSHKELRASLKSSPSMRFGNFISNEHILKVCGIA